MNIQYIRMSKISAVLLFAMVGLFLFGIWSTRNTALVHLHYWTGGSAPLDSWGSPPSPLQAKVALITGGAGFVGRHFSHRLCSNGWHVTIVDNMMSESAINPQKWPLHLQCPDNTIHFIRQDCRVFFKQPTSQRQWSLFLHLAAVVGGRQVIEGSPLIVADDLSIDAAAFQWAIDRYY